MEYSLNHIIRDPTIIEGVCVCALTKGYWKMWDASRGLVFGVFGI